MWDRLAGSLLAAALCLPGTALADELIFKNGDRLSGTVVRLEEGKISFDSAVVGSVSVAVDELESFTTEEPIELHLTDGRVVSDRVALADSGSVRFASDRSQIGFAEIEEINPEPVRWHGSVAAGLTLERGNTDSQDADIEFKARRATDDYRFNLHLRYKGKRSRSSGGDYQTDDRIYRGTTQYDRFLRDRLFAYGRLRGERDGLADLDLRTITGSGLGFQLFKRSDLSFEIQGELAWVHEDYGRDDSLNTDYSAAVFRWDLDKALHDTVHFFHEAEWVSSLRDFNDLQLFTTETGLRIDLAKGWFAEAKLHWELDTEPASGKERKNTEYIFALGWGF